MAAFSAFSVLGLFAGLAPTFLGGVLHEGSHAVQGAVVFLLMAVGTVTQLLLSRFSGRRVMLAGLGLFLAALALIVAALSQAALALFLAVLAFSILLAALCLFSLVGIWRALLPPGRPGAARAGEGRRVTASQYRRAGDSHQT